MSVIVSVTVRGKRLRATTPMKVERRVRARGVRDCGGDQESELGILGFWGFFFDLVAYIIYIILNQFEFGWTEFIFIQTVFEFDFDRNQIGVSDYRLIDRITEFEVSN